MLVPDELLQESDYLQKYGFSEADLSQLYDGRCADRCADNRLTFAAVRGESVRPALAVDELCAFAQRVCYVGHSYRSRQGKFPQLIAEAGLDKIKSGEVNCPFEYKDFETFWYGNISAGPFQGMLKMVSENELKSAVREAVDSFRLDDGRILIPKNIFKYVSANI